MNSLIDIGAITILVLLTVLFQLVLSLPKGSWTSLIFPSLVLYIITRLLFHYVYLLKNVINNYLRRHTMGCGCGKPKPPQKPFPPQPQQPKGK